MQDFGITVKASIHGIFSKPTSLITRNIDDNLCANLLEDFIKKTDVIDKVQEQVQEQPAIEQLQEQPDEQSIEKL